MLYALIDVFDFLRNMFGGDAVVFQKFLIVMCAGAVLVLDADETDGLAFKRKGLGDCAAESADNSSAAIIPRQGPAAAISAASSIGFKVATLITRTEILSLSASAAFKAMERVAPQA